MDPAVATMLGASITSSVNAGSSLLDGLLNREYNEKQVNKQWSRMLEQWNRENAYNHPYNELARLKEANINPALAYMNGASFAPAASSPSPDRASSNSYGIKQMVDPMTMANINVAEAQAESLRADADLKRSQVPVNEQQVINLRTQVDEMLEHMNLMRSQAGYQDALVGLTKAQQGHYMELANKTYEETRRLKATYDDFIKDVRANREITEARASQIVAELKAQRDALIAQAQYYRSVKNLNESEKALLDKKIANYETEFNKQIEEANARINDYKSQVNRRTTQSKVDIMNQMWKPLDYAQRQSEIFMNAIGEIMPL